MLTKKYTPQSLVAMEKKSTRAEIYSANMDWKELQLNLPKEKGMWLIL